MLAIMQSHLDVWLSLFFYCEQVKKAQQTTISIPGNCISEGNDSEDDMDANDDVHVW